MSRNIILKKCALWTSLALLSGLLALGLDHFNIPAAFLLGPMLVAICFGVSGADIFMPRLAFPFAQAAIGCLLAHSLNEAIVLRILEDWLPMCLVLVMTISAGALVGWVMAHHGHFSGPTAAWGSSPGGAAAMIVMSGEFGADMRLVAFMQYLRVLLVVATASLAAGVLGPEHASIPTPAVESHDMDGLLGTAALIVIGALAGRFLRIPARRITASNDRRRRSEQFWPDGIADSAAFADCSVLSGRLAYRPAFHPIGFSLCFPGVAATYISHAFAHRPLLGIGFHADGHGWRPAAYRLSGHQPGRTRKHRRHCCR